MVIKTNFGTKQASEFNLGLVRFATPDEAILGIRTNKAVTPKGLNEAINSEEIRTFIKEKYQGSIVEAF